MSPARPVPPALIAILSSPVSISQYAIVTLVEDEGSMPSVLRAVFGVLILTPHAVNLSVRSTDTWKFGELRSMMRYSVKLSLCRTVSRRVTLGDRSLILASLARSHHETFSPSSVAPPRPSIDPSPMMPEPGARSASRNGLHPRPRWLTTPRPPGGRSESPG